MLQTPIFGILSSSPAPYTIQSLVFGEHQIDCFCLFQKTGDDDCLMMIAFIITLREYTYVFDKKIKPMK